MTLKNHSKILLLLLLLSVGSTVQAAKGQKLCPRWELQSDEIHLSDTESKLICGDSNNHTWNLIPDNQAIFNLRNFLQSRGYFHPKFDKKNDVNLVDPGPVTKVSHFRVTGGPDDFNPKKLREIEGEILKPDLLDSVKTRVNQKLRALGFGCPQIEVEANYDTAEILAHLKTGDKLPLVNVTEEKIEGVEDGLFRRYDAFKLGETFNGDLLHLTENRILTQSVVQSTFFETKCEPDGIKVHQRFIAGPPRLITIGAGFDTERLFTLRAAWRNSRWGNMASSLEISAAASFKDQSFQVDSSWYFLPYPSRFYLRPSFSFKHENYQDYEHLTSKIQLSPSITFDNQTLGVRLSAGPTLNLNRTIRGSGPSFSKFLSLHTELIATSHEYELHRGTPQDGWDLHWEGDFTQNGALSNVTARMLRLTVDKLWNIFSYDPPLFVLGFRAHLGSTLTAEHLTSDVLPTDFRFFLGGSTDLRGFSLRELPGNNGRGALTSADAELELRANILPWGLEPFAFVDAGMMGTDPLSFGGPLFWSPGLGLRWQFQFGVIRASIARGLFSEPGISKDHSHTQFYFSFGEEF